MQGLRTNVNNFPNWHRKLTFNRPPPPITRTYNFDGDLHGANTLEVYGLRWVGPRFFEPATALFTHFGTPSWHVLRRQPLSDRVVEVVGSEQLMEVVLRWCWATGEKTAIANGPSGTETDSEKRSAQLSVINSNADLQIAFGSFTYYCCKQLILWRGWQPSKPSTLASSALRWETSLW